MRVLFSSTGGQGHVQPMLPLAGAFRDQGHEVMWVAPLEATGRVAGAGFAVRAAGRGVAWCGAEYSRRWPQAHDLPKDQAMTHMYSRVFGDVAASAAAAELGGIVREFRPGLVVHEAAEYAAPALAAVLGLPAVTHGVGLGIRPASVAEACRLASAPLPTTVLDICPPSLRLAEIPAPPGATPLRPAGLEPLAGDALPPEVEHALTRAGERPVVHLTFGTVYVNPEDLRRTAAAIAELDVLLVVAGAVDQPVPGVVMAEYVPHSLLLPHCRVVVAHGGAGVMFKALGAGLPQVCVPKGALSDQFRNASAVQAAGAGLAVADEATPEAIAAATSRLLADPAFTAAAGRVAAEIAAMPSPADVARSLVGSVEGGR